MDYKNEDFLKETGLSDDDVQELKETFKVKYADKMGWDVEDLTSEQIIEIQNQDGYKKAGQLFS